MNDKRRREREYYEWGDLGKRPVTGWRLTWFRFRDKIRDIFR